jgi:hypothetical protein
VLLSHTARAEPARHGPGASPVVREPHRVQVDPPDMDGQYLTGRSPFDVDAAAGWVTSPYLCLKSFLVGVAFEPRAAVHLGLYFEDLSGRDVKGRFVIRTNLEIELVPGGALHTFLLVGTLSFQSQHEGHLYLAPGVSQYSLSRASTLLAVRLWMTEAIATATPQG